MLNLKSANIVLANLRYCQWFVYVFSLWLDGVMPMVMDKEASVQEKCFSLLEEFLLSQITPHTRYAHMYICAYIYVNYIHMFVHIYIIYVH